MGSPDRIRRNLDLHIVSVTTLLDNYLRNEIINLLNIQLNDNQKACFVDENLKNVFKNDILQPPIRAQYAFYAYLKDKNETFL